jgi:hypothetical protein
MSIVTATKPATGSHYYVLLVDCGGDALVRERIKEEHEGLTDLTPKLVPLGFRVCG